MLSRASILLLIAGLVYLFALQIQAVWPFTIDDMYIPLRYARHWAEGYGLVWNVAEMPVEGYSNFSFVLLGRLALELGLDPVIVLKSAGVAGLGLTCTAMYTLSRFWFFPRLAVIPVIWLLAYRGQVIWTVSGLETTVYQALIVFSLVFVFQGMGYRPYPETKTNQRVNGFVYAGILLSLASLTRPEAPALMVLFALLAFIENPGSSRIIFRFLLVFLICFTGYFIWRWQLFGRLFPNPVYCKGMSDPGNLVLDKKYLALAWPFLVLAIPAIWKNPDRRHYFLWLPGVMYAVFLIGASPVVAFDNRLFLPAFVLLLPLSLQGIYTILQNIIKRQDIVTDSAVYLSAGLLIFFCIPMLSLAQFRQYTQNPLAGEHLREGVLSWLENNTTSSSRVVLADSGMIPWRSSLQFTDSYCLNNADMTRDKHQGMYQRLCKSVLQERPEVIILTSLMENGREIYTPADVCLSKRLKSDKHYQLQASLKTGNAQGFYRYEIYQIKRNV